jgi:hypothetical protein
MLYSFYFFSGKHYIRVTMGDTVPGTVDHGFNPSRPISYREWSEGFDAQSIDTALYTGGNATSSEDRE